jgi:sec-independent protein translocase protein TatA
MQLLAGLGPLGLPELAVIAFIVVLVFGVGRLPEVGGAVGKGIREFRKATKEDEPVGGSTMQSAAPASEPAAVTTDTFFCSECGGRNVRGAKFCAHCGHGIEATIS